MVNRAATVSRQSSQEEVRIANKRKEMSHVNGNDPNRLLNETRDADRAIDGLEQDLDRLKTLQIRNVEDTEASSNSSNQVEAYANETIAKYQGLAQRIKKLKSDPQSGSPRNSAQVGKVDRRLKTMINKFQQQEKEYRDRLRERSAREYRIVRPDASDAEVREATEDPGNVQIFSQAVRRISCLGGRPANEHCSSSTPTAVVTPRASPTTSATATMPLRRSRVICLS